MKPRWWKALVYVVPLVYVAGVVVAVGAVVGFGEPSDDDTSPTIDGTVGVGEYDINHTPGNTGFGGLFQNFYLDYDASYMYFAFEIDPGTFDGNNNNAIILYLDTDAASSSVNGSRFLADHTDNSTFVEGIAGFERGDAGGPDPEWGTGGSTYTFDPDFALVLTGYADDDDNGGFTGAPASGDWDAAEVGFFGLDDADLGNFAYLTVNDAYKGNDYAEFQIAISALNGFGAAGLNLTSISTNTIYFSALLANGDNDFLSNESAPDAHTAQGNGTIDVVNVGSFTWDISDADQIQAVGGVPEPGTLGLMVVAGFVLSAARRRRLLREEE